MPPLLAALLFFSVFIPNPAIPIGDSTGLQFYQVIAVFFCAMNMRERFSAKTWGLIAVIYIPMLFSACSLGVAGLSENLLLSLKGIVGYALPIPVYLAGTLIFAKWKLYLKPCFVAASAGILLNVIIGLYQLLQFQSSEFPLLGVYNNPEFASFAEVFQDYAEYVKRPFGLFPEPSALGAALLPILMVYLGYVFPLFDWAVERAAGYRLAAAVVLCLALLLVYLSESGLAYLAPLSLLVGEIFKRSSRDSSSATVRALVLMFSVCLIFFAAYIFILPQLVARITIEQGLSFGSWAQRLTSVYLGLGGLGESVRNAVFGLGPGTSHLYVSGLDSDVTAIYSSLIRYVCETGILGALGISLCGIKVWVGVWRSGARGMGVAVYAMWFLAIVLSTSYWSLGPLWLTLAALVNWEMIFPPGPPAESIQTVGES